MGYVSFREGRQFAPENGWLEYDLFRLGWHQKLVHSHSDFLAPENVPLNLHQRCIGGVKIDVEKKKVSDLRFDVYGCFLKSCIRKVKKTLAHSYNQYIYIYMFLKKGRCKTILIFFVSCNVICKWFISGSFR